MAQSTPDFYEPAKASPDDLLNSTDTSGVRFSTSLMLHRYPLLWFVTAWAVGLYFAKLPAAVANLAGWPLLVGATAFLILGLINRQFACRSGLLILFSIMLTGAWHTIQSAPPTEDSLSSLATRGTQPVALRGTIESAATWSPNSLYRPDQSESEPWATQWNIRWQAIREIDQWNPITSRSKLSVAGRIDNYLPGDVLEVFGGLRQIESQSNPGVFDFARRAGRDGLFVAIRAKDMKQIQRVGTDWRYIFNRLRGWATRAVDSLIHRYVDRGQAPLAAALVFGQRSQVDWEDQQQLMASGTLHMLSISGMHVEMVAGTLYFLCRLFSVRRTLSLITVVAICLLYAGLAGSNPPVLRAVVLVICIAAANYWGLNARLTNLLSLAGWILLLLNPSNIENIGVQLSFLAVIIIGVFHSTASVGQPRPSALQDLFEERFSRTRRWLLSLRVSFFSACRISFWVWLITTPLIWHNFHVVSPIAVPLNVVLALPLTVGLLAGLVTGLLGWIAPIGWLAGKIAGAGLALISGLVDLSCRIPLGHVWLPAPPVWWSGVFYAIVLIWLITLKTQRQRALATLLLFWLLLGVAWYIPGPRGLAGWPRQYSTDNDSQLRCTFLDVGHGTSVLLELPDGRVWMYDAGSMGDSKRSHESIAPAVWSVHSARIDTLIISHADSDHYNAVRGMLERFEVGRVISTGRFWSDTSPDVASIIETMKSKNIPRETWDAHSTIEAAGPVEVSVLHPARGFRAESDNADSLSLQLEYAGVRVLLPGDLEGSGMIKLLEAAPRNVQILMAPHHGSLAHDASGLIHWCQPTVIAISGGERTLRPAVAAKYSDASTLGITFRDRAIQVRIDADGTFGTYHWHDSNWTALTNRKVSNHE